MEEKIIADDIGPWSETKLRIIQSYAVPYAQILNNADWCKGYLYIDGFAGAGFHRSKGTGELVPGTPLNVLAVRPPFSAYHFIELDNGKFNQLSHLMKGKPNVHVHRGDCNGAIIPLLNQVPYKSYRRAFCLLDPYGLHLDWNVIRKAGELTTIDMLLYFPIMDMNRNALHRNPEGVSEDSIQRMTRYWGDESWKQAAYAAKPGLFGPMEEKNDNEDIVQEFLLRLKNVAGFKHVAKPLAMRNKTNTAVYYLLFASCNSTAIKIMNDIFSSIEDRRYNVSDGK